MKKINFLSLILFVSVLQAQVPKKVVVEHFTNTKCSICAARNPGFYMNLNNQPNVLHLAIHPSSPYAGCLLNQHNVAENDARTNYYGVYGSTPILMIQGVLIQPSVDYSSAAMFTPYLGQTTPASIRIRQMKFGNDSIRSTIVIRTEATHTLGALRLFVALAEDTVFYTGSNGEPQHRDVFRKSMGGATGMNVTLPALVGDSVVITVRSPSNSVWNFSRMFTLAILQEDVSKAVVQSEKAASDPSVMTGISNVAAGDFSCQVFVSDQENHTIVFKQGNNQKDLNFVLYDVMGRKLLNQRIVSETENINGAALSPGIYLFVVESNTGILKSGKLVIH